MHRPRCLPKPRPWEIDQDTHWLFNIAMENGPFIDGLPIKNGGSFHGYVSHNQRVIVWLKHDQERNWGNHIPVHLEGPNRIRSQTNAHLIGASHEHSLYFQP